MDKGFEWSGWIKPKNQYEGDFWVIGGKFAKDKDGNYIIRTDKEIEASLIEDIEYGL